MCVSLWQLVLATSFIGCVSLRGLSTSFACWYIAAYTVWLLITWPAGSNACPMLWIGDIYMYVLAATSQLIVPVTRCSWRPGVPCRRCTRLECSSALSDIDTSIPSQFLFVVLSLSNVVVQCPRSGFHCDSVTVISSNLGLVCCVYFVLFVLSVFLS